MEFFGSQTKTYRHPTDPNSGLYCTVPVKYEFENKDDRIRAETVLRDLCDIHCTTPYPPLIRESIKQIITKVKQENPDNLIKVNISVEKKCFKVGLKAKAVGDEKVNWVPYKVNIPIPEVAMDVNIRRVPEGFTVPWPEPKSPRKSSSSNVNMEVTEVTPAP
jgi:hypothetical protein